MLSDYQKALDELAWRFQSAEAALGIRAQNIAEGKGGGVFDDMASHRAHMSKRTDRHHTAVTRMRRVDACLAALPRRTVEDLAVAFTPAGRANHVLFRAFALQTPFHEVSLLGYALHVGLVLAAFQRAHGGSEPRSRDTMLGWLNDEATKGKNVVAGVVADTRIALESAVAAYDVQRLARLEVERESRERAQREREVVLARELEALNLKLWGRVPESERNAEEAFLAMEASQNAAEARAYAALEESAGDWEYGVDYGHEDDALDRIYSEVDALLCDGRFDAVDDRLRTTDVASLPVVQLLALLSITDAARDRLAEHRLFLARVRRHLTQVDPHRVDALLGGFGANDVVKVVA